MSDLIKRADALRELNGACSNWEDDAKVQEIVMAIPSAKPTGDIISRADVVEEISKGVWNVHELIDRIKALPSAEAVQGWIPIEESEPNTTDHVLVTYKWGGNDYEVSELDYWVTKYESERGNEQCIRLINHVLAWMPLPTPYKGDEDDNA